MMGDKQKWHEKYLNSKFRDYSFDSASGKTVSPLYSSDDSKIDESDIGYPGEFPYTRGIHPNMYRGKLWTMRQFSGFGSPKETAR